MRVALVACVLLGLSAAALAQVDIAAVPEAAQPSAVKCLKKYPDSCSWGPANCASLDNDNGPPNCQLCAIKDVEGVDKPVCFYCVPGYYNLAVYVGKELKEPFAEVVGPALDEFLNNGGDQCVICPEGFWCAGSKINACKEGEATSGEGNWAASQCAGI